MTSAIGTSTADVPATLLARGMRDLLPDDVRRLRRIETAFLDVCRAWGYDEVRTPTLEHLYLFTMGGTLTPQLLTDVYSFLDWDGWSGERVVLRPEATIPVARLYRERLNTPAAKLAYVVNTFRFHAGDAPREVWQCGAELIGAPWPAGDIEALSVAVETLRALGIGGLTLEIAHAGVARALLEHAGFNAEEVAELYDRILDGSSTLAAEVGGRVPELTPALGLLAQPPGEEGFIANLKAVFASVPALTAALDELATLAAAARALGMTPGVVVAAQRDFEYYTGPVFRLYAAGEAVAGGGRYDRLVTNADGATRAACGFALFADRLAPLLPDQAESASPFVRVAPAHNDGAGYAAATAAAAALRARGVIAGLFAASEQARWTLTVAATGGLQLSGRAGGDGIAAGSIDDVAAIVRGLQP
jgi:histidyl-tRNA synthetase